MKFCEHCGTKAREMSKFCPVCGVEIRQTKRVEEPNTTAPPPNQEAPRWENQANAEGYAPFVLEPVDNSEIWDEYFNKVILTILKPFGLLTEDDEEDIPKSKLARDFEKFQSAGSTNLIAMKTLKKRARTLEFLASLMGALVSYYIAIIMSNQPYWGNFEGFIKNSSNTLLKCIPLFLPTSILSLIARSITGDFLVYQDVKENTAQQLARNTLLNRGDIVYKIFTFLLSLVALYYSAQSYSISGDFWMACENFVILTFVVNSFAYAVMGLRWWMLFFWFPLVMIYLVPISRLFLS